MVGVSVGSEVKSVEIGNGKTDGMSVVSVGVDVLSVGGFEGVAVTGDAVVDA